MTENPGGSSKPHRGGRSVGMISVLGKTYRIMLVKAGRYDAVRLLDDIRVGSFGDEAPVSVDSSAEGETLLRQIARVAKQAAKTRWIPDPLQLTPG